MDYAAELEARRQQIRGNLVESWHAEGIISAETLLAIKGVAPDVIKVGPHGYIHGWIFVGAPGNLTGRGREAATDERGDHHLHEDGKHVGMLQQPAAGNGWVASVSGQGKRHSSLPLALAHVSRQLDKLKRSTPSGIRDTITKIPPGPWTRHAQDLMHGAANRLDDPQLNIHGRHLALSDLRSAAAALDHDGHAKWAREVRMHAREVNRVIRDSERVKPFPRPPGSLPDV